MKSRILKWTLISVIGLLVVIAGLGYALLRHWSKVHQHCIKVTGGAFTMYAQDHEGVLPFHTNGFGDALLLLVKEGYLPGVAWICGPDDNGMVLSNALTHGLNVPEEQCSRVYIQGLTRTNDSQLCILFDRRSVPGGDHFYGMKPPLREACMVDGSTQMIRDTRWPEFSRQQVALLVEAGWSREKALEYYPEAATGISTNNSAAPPVARP